jgi:hypothetical protein
MYRRIGNGQWLDADRGAFLNHAPFLEGETVQTSQYGTVRVVEFKEVEILREGEKFIFPAFCGGLEIRSKTEYANFIDFEHINTGKRKICDTWISFNLGLQENRAYMLLCEKNKKYPCGLRIINKRLLT